MPARDSLTLAVLSTHSSIRSWVLSAFTFN